MGFLGDFVSNTLGSAADIGKNTASSLSDVGKNTISSAQDIARNPVQAIKNAVNSPFINPVGVGINSLTGISPTQQLEIGALGGLGGMELGIGTGAGAVAPVAGAGLTSAGADAYAVPTAQSVMLANQTAGLGATGLEAGTAGTTAAGTASGAAAGGGMSTSQMIALGLGGANALGGILKGPAQTPNLVNPQIQQAGNTLLNQAMNGQLNPGDQARIAQDRQQALARTQAYYAQAGLSDSSMAQSAMTDINARYDQAAYQITQGYYQQAMQAAGITNLQTAQQVQLQMQADQQAQAAQANFFNVLMMYGLSR